MHTELYLIALLIIFSVPYLIWRLGSTEFFAPLVVVQIIMGIVLGPGLLGHIFPEYYQHIFTHDVVQSLNGLAWWAVMLFVFLAGIELNINDLMMNKKESAITAGLALGTPLIIGVILTWFFLIDPDWMGNESQAWQFALGIGMSCAVTALPILILFMEKLGIYRNNLGQRILRYASLDDIAIWAVLALILLDWARIGKQLGFVLVYIITSFLFRKLMLRVSQKDRWYLSLIWLLFVGLGADWAGLHFMVGAFLAGVALERDWFGTDKVDQMRDHVLLLLMPVFFISTGLRTAWTLDSTSVFWVALLLLAAAVFGKLLGLQLASIWLKWSKGEAWLIGWLLQTKALIMIIFANVLLDKHIITANMFTALLVMAVLSTMLTIPVVSRSPLLKPAEPRPDEIHTAGPNVMG